MYFKTWKLGPTPELAAMFEIKERDIFKFEIFHACALKYPTEFKMAIIPHYYNTYIILSGGNWEYGVFITFLFRSANFTTKSPKWAPVSVPWKLFTTAAFIRSSYTETLYWFNHYLYRYLWIGNYLEFK